MWDRFPLFSLNRIVTIQSGNYTLLYLFSHFFFRNTTFFSYTFEYIIFTIH